MPKKSIAVISAYRKRFLEFKTLITDNNNIELIHVSDIEDARGKQFDGYCCLYDSYEIKNFDQVLHCVKIRTIN